MRNIYYGIHGLDDFPLQHYDFPKSAKYRRLAHGLSGPHPSDLLLGPLRLIRGYTPSELKRWKTRPGYSILNTCLRLARFRTRSRETEVLHRIKRLPPAGATTKQAPQAFTPTHSSLTNQTTIMQFLLALISLAAAVMPFAQADTVSYDTTYDNSGQSLSTVACSDGPNGLMSKGYTTFGSLPDFPYIGGAAAVASWDSPNCGTCWQLTYNGKSINVLAVDHADSGFNIAEEAMNDLTDGQAVFLGRIDAVATQVDASQCGL
ncbi:Cerato-platanin-domain-containing protein [Heliocybe sulcata]|uniref:Cerato-platanin-domain-containing protein n=1 Tax=Heliocybe sulcata TaxID=5364 RepID=A0A5C3MLS8_9AGAM|nr:Cerato-platanin-domain-containing protein [Heliocybe sulcata]